MADDSMALLETLRKVGAQGDVDFLREGVAVLASAIMEAEVGAVTGVPKGTRDPDHRLTQRNGYRDRRSSRPLTRAVPSWPRDWYHRGTSLGPSYGCVDAPA